MMDREQMGAARRYIRSIRRKKLEIEELRASLLPSANRYDRDKVQSSPGDVIGKIEARIDELEREIAELELKKADAICDIGRAIDKAENLQAAEFMTDYFINGKRSREIAKEWNFTTRWINKVMQEELERMNKDGRKSDERE